MRPIGAVLAVAGLLLPTPARLFVLTDIGGDPDDEQSLVRLLAHANDIEVEGLCATSRLEHGHDVRPEAIERLVGAYGRVRDRLARHASGYPEAAALVARVHAGLGDPGPVGPGLDSPCSEALLRAAERDDPRPLFVTIWGGARELAQALDRARRSWSAERYEALLARLRVHAIGDQDGHRPALVAEPGLHLVAYGFVSQGRLKVPELSAYRGLYQTGEPWLVSRRWVERNVREGHGPLGALYPRDGGGVEGLKEGDTPSFLGLLPTGLQAPERPGWGGWGGRFRLLRGRLWVDALDLLDGTWNERHTVSRWRDAFQRELAARMDWMVADRFEDANHPPAPVVDGEDGLAPVRRTVRPGQRLQLDAGGSSDPDGDRLRFRWFVYHEASGNLGEALRLEGSDGPRAGLTLPADTRLVLVHLILEVTDGGTPPLTRYRRALVDVRR